MPSVRISEFDTWRPGYGGSVVRVYVAGTTTLADIFTDEERETLNLPFDGEWKCIQQSKEGMDS